MYLILSNMPPVIRIEYQQFCPRNRMSLGSVSTESSPFLVGTLRGS